ncbi:hypothetical protein AC249_AIPGENE25283 [Exaiptasia diaphana]|nr:hypothetical protein AC249_AIPGENE25283 [Exaiptasia diaphana]
MLGTASVSYMQFLEDDECSNSDLDLNIESIEENPSRHIVPGGSYVPIAPKPSGVYHQVPPEDGIPPLQETVTYMSSRLYHLGRKNQVDDDPPTDSPTVKQWRREMKSAFSKAENLQYYFMLAQLTNTIFHLYQECLRKMEIGEIERNSKGRRISAGTFNFLENRKNEEKKEVLESLLGGEKTIKEVRKEITDRRLKRKTELSADDLRRPNMPSSVCS